MLDLQIILEQPEKLSKMLQQRSWEGVSVHELQKWISEKKRLTGAVQKAQNQRNQVSTDIGQLLKQARAKEVAKKKVQVKELSDEISRLSEEQKRLNELLDGTLETLPNWLDEEVPLGGEEANKLIREWGEKPDFSFSPKTHYEIGQAQGLLDFERGTKISGSRFYTYWGYLARLERCLLHFMLDLHRTEFGYTEVFVPLLVNDACMFTTGQFPKFRGEYYSLERDGLSLIPTAEVPLVNLYQKEILKASELPIALAAASSCFRREAGAAGKDTRGLVRVHQFQKVELVQIAHPENSRNIHEQMVSHAEEVLRRLALPYRLILKAVGDTGASATKSYDLEVWMPGLKRWLEIASISHCLDYQARRGMIRFREKNEKSKPRFVHTLNGSGVAAGRCMIAIMENYQKEDLSFSVPEVLQKYL